MTRQRDAETIRLIRNACREFMTRDTRAISDMEQLRWFLWTYKPQAKVGRLRVFLYDVGSHTLGYGLIRQGRGRVWLSGGLMPIARGRGLGAQLFAHLVEEAGETGVPIYLEVLKTNERARALYERLGFETVAVRGKALVMRL